MHKNEEFLAVICTSQARGNAGCRGFLKYADLLGLRSEEAEAKAGELGVESTDLSNQVAGDEEVL